MINDVTDQLISFLQFVAIGLLIALIFDFFRAYRSLKKVNNFTVVIQDIIYFIIATGIIIFGIINFLDSSLRLYIFLAIIVGIMLYISLLSRFILKIYNVFFKTLFELLEIIFIPLKLILQIIQKIYKIFEKIIKKCCKKFFNMLSFICKPLNKIKIPDKLEKIKINKRGPKKYEKREESKEA